MRIVYNELKKIFNIKSLLVLCVISFIIFKIFIRFHINIFPNGRPEGDIYDIAKRIVEEIEINVSEVNVDYFLNLKKEYKDEANNYLLNNPLAQELGISTYEELQNVGFSKTESDSNENDRKAAELHSNIIFHEQVDCFWKVQAADNFINMYNYRNRSDNFNSLSQKQKDRVNVIMSRRDYKDVLPEFVLGNYNTFIFNSTALIVISIIFLLAPIYIKDEHRNLEQIQYTTKRGRKLYKDKIITALIASVIIVTIELSILFFLYLTRENTVEMFYNASISSWYSVRFYWFDLTFKQYIIVTIVLIYIFSLALSLFIAFVSRKCNRYITLIGICLLLAIGLFKLVTLEFLLWFGIGWIYKPKFLILGFLSFMAILGISLVSIRNKNEKKRSILN
jgi:hypothetical protein